MSSAILRRGLLFTFALPAVIQGFMHAPAQSLLQGIYAKHTGLALTALGGAVMFVRIFDACSDALIGYLSDLTARRSGSRKPWLVAGTVVSSVAIWHLFRPPADVSVLYFGAWFLVANIGWSLIEIPYRAWSLELSRDYAQRNRIAVWIGVLSMAGVLLFYMVPVVAKSAGLAQSTAYDMDSLALAAIVIIVLLPPLNLAALARVPNTPVEPAPPKESWRELWRSIAGNGPLVRFTLAFLIVTLGGGLSAGVSYLFFDVYLGLSQQLAVLLIATVPISVLGIPFWGWLCMRYERQKVWAVAMTVVAVCFTGLGFVPPGEASLAPVAGLYLVAMFCILSSLVVAPAMLGDIVDYGRLHFRHDRAGVYFAFYSVVLKTATGVALGLGLAIVGWFGFDATATTQTPSAIFGMKLVCAWLPALGLAGMIPLLWTFPITRATHADMVARLEAREAGT